MLDSRRNDDVPHEKPRHICRRRRRSRRRRGRCWKIQHVAAMRRGNEKI